MQLFFSHKFNIFSLLSRGLQNNCIDHEEFYIYCHEPGVSFAKSNLRAIDLPFDSSFGDVSFRFSRLLAFTPGPPVVFISTLPSTSSRTCPASCVLHLGSLEGCVG